MALLISCSKQSSLANENGITTEIADPQTGVMIRVHIPSDTIGIADRITLQVDVEWALPATASIVPPDFEEQGWVLVDTYANPTQLHDGLYSTTNTYTLEPFLAGEYTIPTIAVDITPDSEADYYQLLSMPMLVVVKSVLDTDDGGELVPAYGFTDASALESNESDSLMIPAIAVGMVLFAFVILLRVMTHKDSKQTPPPSAHALLKRVVHKTHDNEPEGYSTLHQALMLLDTQLLGTSEIHGFVQECERAQFSPDQQISISPAVMAQHTLDLLGQWEEGAA